MILGLKSKLALGGLSAAVILALLLWVQIERSGRQAAEKEAQAAQAMLEQSEDAREQEKASAARTEKLAQTLQEQLSDAETLYDRAISDAIAGSAGLLIDADCPTVPDSSATTSESDAAGARLSQSAQLRVHRIRRDARRAEVMISGLQEYIRSECTAKKEGPE